MATALLKLRRYMADSTFLEAKTGDELLHAAADWTAFKALVGDILTSQMLNNVEDKFQKNQQLSAGMVYFIKNRGTLASTTAASWLQASSKTRRKAPSMSSTPKTLPPSWTLPPLWQPRTEFTK